MNILIIGCGRVGTSLALTLSEMGHDVAVLDRSRTKLDKIKNVFSGLLFCGVPIDNDVLKSAGIAACDIVCAVTDEENTNITVSQIAKEIYKVKKVFTRVFDPYKGGIFKDFGLNTVCSTALTADAIVSAMDDYEDEQFLNYGGKKLKFYTIEVPKEYIEVKAHEIELEEGEVFYGLIRSDGTVKLLNNYNVELQEGDKLIFSKVLT